MPYRLGYAPINVCYYNNKIICCQIVFCDNLILSVEIFCSHDYRLTYKPSSVLCPKARDDHLSRTLIAQNLKQPTRKICEQLHPFPIRSCFGWGLPSQPVTRLLVRSYRTFAPLPDCSGGISLWH